MSELIWLIFISFAFAIEFPTPTIENICAGDKQCVRRNQEAILLHKQQQRELIRLSTPKPKQSEGQQKDPSATGDAKQEQPVDSFLPKENTSYQDLKKFYPSVERKRKNPELSDPEYTFRNLIKKHGKPPAEGEEVFETNTDIPQKFSPGDPIPLPSNLDRDRKKQLEREKALKEKAKLERDQASISEDEKVGNEKETDKSESENKSPTSKKAGEADKREPNQEKDSKTPPDSEEAKDTNGPARP